MDRLEKRIWTVLAVFLAIVVVIKLYDRPDPLHAARRLYEENQEVFDTLGEYYLAGQNTGGVFFDDMLQEYQEDPAVDEQVRSAMEAYCNLRIQGRWHHISVEKEPYDAPEAAAVMFSIYSYTDDQTSIGGEYIQYYQYLTYAPLNPDKIFNSGSYDFTEITPLCDGWYLVMDRVL